MNASKQKNFLMNFPFIHQVPKSRTLLRFAYLFRDSLFECLFS